MVVFSLLPQAVFGQPGAPLPPPTAPPENPITTAKINLGKVLFWDEQLSSTWTVACGTCHIPSGGNSDPRTAVSPVAVAPGPDALFGTADDILGSPGVPQSLADGTYSAHASFGILEQATTRRSKAASEAGYAAALFWDGRAGDALIDPETAATVIPAGAALETQALGPILSEVEMAHLGRSWNDVVDRLSGAEPLALAADLPAELDSWIGNRGYPELFAEAFGDANITPTRIAMAIATYERTLVSNQTPLDVANAGGAPLTPLQQQGRTVFATSCGGCHAPPLFSDDLFHYIGVRPVNDDLGRFALTGAPIDRGAMRTPSLRNVGLRAPYMHNGQLATLEDVVDFYDRGGDFNAPNKPPIIQPLGLTPTEKTALVAFLREALTDPRAESELAPFDRPSLYTESSLVPEVLGTGVPGAGGLEPQVVALEPPFAGNPSFTVGVWGSVPGATALLAIDTTDPGLTPPPAADFAWVEVPLTVATIGAGSASVSLAIPDDDATRGTTYFGRWYVDDPAAAGGTAVSALLTFTVEPTRRGVGSEIFADGFDSGSTGQWSAVEGAP
jgi:cytochrome c peroxidase